MVKGEQSVDFGAMTGQFQEEDKSSERQSPYLYYYMQNSPGTLYYGTQRAFIHARDEGYAPEVIPSSDVKIENGEAIMGSEKWRYEDQTIDEQGNKKELPVPEHVLHESRYPIGQLAGNIEALPDDKVRNKEAIVGILRLADQLLSRESDDEKENQRLPVNQYTAVKYVKKLLNELK